MVNDILIPSGLLQGISNGPYNNHSRRDASDLTARVWVDEILSDGPTVTLVQSRTISPEPGLDPPSQSNATIALTLPSFPNRPVFTSTPFQQAFDVNYGQTKKSRSRSIDYSNLHHGHFEKVLQPLPNVFVPGQRRRAASITIGSLQRGHVQMDAFTTRGDVSRGVSPTMLEGGTSTSQSTDRIRPRLPEFSVDEINQLLQKFPTDKRSSPIPRLSPISRSTSTRSRASQRKEENISPLGIRFDEATIISHPQRRATVPDEEPSLLRRASVAVVEAVKNVVPPERRSSIRITYENAKLRQKKIQRSKISMFIFQYAIYVLIFAFVYFVLVGQPLWGGVVWYIYVLFQHYLTIPAGSAIFIGLATFYAFGPLLVALEKPAPPPRVRFQSHPAIRLDPEISLEPCDCALLIPCYKSEKILPATLAAAMEIFPPQNIFVINNANTPTPPDNTEGVCTKYGVNHVWCPVGSKLVAQYVGCHVAKAFPYVLMIDDDCALPPNFPIHTSRLRNHVKVLGYTIKSTGPNSSRGSWCQQAQDLEYKLSGIQRQFAGSLGSATFPHGAISLWDREFLAETFDHHPGFSVSEDWFFGHIARTLGSRIKMCSSIFVETETPASLFFAPRSENRGGFGEMTVFKQRFSRWNFFFVNGMYWNMRYILFSWKLGFFNEIGAKLFVFQEVYEAFLYIVTPIIFPISFLVRPLFTLWLFLATLVLYLINTVLFNEIHLRRRNERVDGWVVIFYYTGFKLCMVVINCLSTWWSIWKYARYFAQRHPKVVEDERSVGVVLRIEEEQFAAQNSPLSTIVEDQPSEISDLKRKPSTSSPEVLSEKMAQQQASLPPARSSIGRRVTITPMKIEVIPELVLEPEPELDENLLVDDDNNDNNNNINHDDIDVDLEKGKSNRRSPESMVIDVEKGRNSRTSRTSSRRSPELVVIEGVPQRIVTEMTNQLEENKKRSLLDWWKPKPKPSRRGNYIPGPELIDHRGMMRTTSERFGVKTMDWEQLE